MTDKTKSCHAEFFQTNRVLCGWKMCIHWCCDVCGEIVAGFGRMDCPCDHTNGWKSRRVDGQAQPHPPVKAVGRHGSKVMQARRKASKRERDVAKFRAFP